MKFFRFYTFAVLTLFSALLMVSILQSRPTAAQSPTDEPTEEPHSEEVHWTYEGEHGPEHWGDLSEEYEACGTGEAQSPIDISAAQGLDLANIEFNYNPSALNIYNNGETIRVNYDEGSSIIYNEIEYKLLQFHFHTPSEHMVNGQAFDLELHFVHQSASGALAVVGVLINVGEADNEPYAPIFANLSPEKNDPPAETDQMINAADLLPESRLYYTYTGSLTTPPCSQGVRWLVLQSPIYISQTQLEAFTAIFPLNARPVQPLNDRDLLEDMGE